MIVEEVLKHEWAIAAILVVGSLVLGFILGRKS